MSGLARRVVGFAAIVGIASGGCARPSPSPTQPHDPAAVRAAVERLMRAAQDDVSRLGPLGWREHLWKDPAFYLVTFGRRDLDGYEATRRHLDALARDITAIRLNFSDLRVQPLGDSLAAVGAAFDEEITFATGDRRRFSGYVTATAIRSPHGWKLAHMHWSAPLRDSHGHAGER